MNTKRLSTPPTCRFSGISLRCRYLGLGFFMFVLTCSAFCQDDKSSLLDDYNEIWETILSTFPYDSEVFERWERIRLEFREQVLCLSEKNDLTQLCNRMFDQMDISHMQIIPGESKVDDRFPIQTNQLGHAPFALHWDQGAWYLDQISDSLQREFSVENGFQLTSINGSPIPADAAIFSMEYLSGVRKKLFGCLGDRIRVTCLNHQQKPISFETELLPWQGVVTKSFGNFPSIPVLFHTEVVRDVQIISFSNFVMDIHPQILKSIKDSKNHRGLIFDLRGNTGGVGMMANGIVGRISDKEFNMGTMLLKEGKINFHVYPQANPYLGKVAVLIDQFSASTSEIFAQGLKEAGRARVFGSQSMGAALPSKFVRLKSGLLFQQAIATLTSAQGIRLEGNGVNPDTIVYKTKDDLIRNADPVLCSALDWILNDSDQALTY